MNLLKRGWARFARLRRWQQFLLLSGGMMVFLLVFFTASLEALHYSESTAFCTTCHGVMDAEIATHKVSPHANTDCGTCHIGPGAVPRMLDKVYGARYLIILPLDLYERPLETPLETLRPAREICEQCHWPDKFYPISIEVKDRYAEDYDNTLRRVVLPLKTGSGAEEHLDNRGPGIHWHIQNPVYYIAEDEHRQEITWIQTEIDGETVTYTDIEANLTQDDIDDAEIREMDCLDCHNRVTHDVPAPSDLLDEALSDGLIPADLPYIKQQGIAVLQKRYDSDEEALQAIDEVVTYYQEELPDVYAERADDIDQSIAQFKAIFDESHYNFMNVYWDTYPNDVGHKDAPGCFRCHDGKHVNEDGEAIRATCSLCHGVPLVARGDEPLPAVNLTVETEPESHQSSLWLAEHRFAFDITCSECHTATNPAGSDDTSFCSNSACHGSGWDHLAIDAPEIIARVAPEHLVRDDADEGGMRPPPHYISDDLVCTNCHGIGEVVPYPENHVDFAADICLACHTDAVTSQETEVQEGYTPAPQIPHTLEGRDACLACHGVAAGFPYPENHVVYPVTACTTCHTVADAEGAPAD